MPEGNAMGKCVLEWLEKTAKRFPNKTAYQSAEESITFVQVEEQAQRIGSALQGKGEEGRPIAVILEKEVQTIPVFLGVAYSGRAYAPIDGELPQARIQKILEILEPALIITNTTYQNKIESICSENGFSDQQIVLQSELIKAEINEEYLRDIRTGMTENDPLYIIFTSGSTGIPKGVITSHHSLMCYIQAYSAVMEIDESDRLGNQSPLDYIAAIRDIYVPLYKGAGTYLIPKTFFMRPDLLVDILNTKGITSLGWSVSAFTVLTSLGILEKEPIQTVNKICFSGSVMPGNVLRKWQEKMPRTRFVNQYGPTEATASCSYYVVDHPVEDHENIPIGIPYDNYRIYIITDEGRSAAPGEMGEICIAGPALALGYYDNPERSARDFVQNPLNQKYRELIYKTGDIGCLRPDGLFEFHGRKDRQIKHMGHRVELDEIECAAMGIQGVKECAALYDFEKEMIHLYFTGEVTNREIALSLRKELPGFMVPRKMEQIREMPKLANGKIDFVGLRGMMNGKRE